MVNDICIVKLKKVEVKLEVQLKIKVKLKVKVKQRVKMKVERSDKKLKANNSNSQVTSQLEQQDHKISGGPISWVIKS